MNTENLTIKQKNDMIKIMTSQIDELMKMGFKKLLDEDFKNKLIYNIPMSETIPQIFSRHGHLLTKQELENITSFLNINIKI